jgi:hypothetical protein
VVGENYTCQAATRTRKMVLLPLRERLHVPSVNCTGKQVTLKRRGMTLRRKQETRSATLLYVFPLSLVLFARLWAPKSNTASPVSFSVAMASISSRRLQKELKEINTEGCPVGMSLHYPQCPSRSIDLRLFQVSHCLKRTTTRNGCSP